MYGELKVVELSKEALNADTVLLALMEVGSEFQS